MRRAGIGFFLWLLCFGAAAEESIWAQLRAGGYVLLMRHAQTVAGTGDPPGFSLDDCQTQRNLSEEGRAHARRTGEAFRAYGIALSEVRSSAWCRCIDTAMLAFGRASVWPALNSIFDSPERRDIQTEAVRALIGNIRSPDNVMLVTHQINITALTGEPVSSGEIIVVRAQDKAGKRLAVIGKLKLP